MSEAAAARSRIPPGRLFVLGIVLGLFLDWLWPWPVGPYEYVLPAGILLAGFFVVGVVAGLRAFRRHGTSPSEKVETTAIVDTGPYRFSRNPAYIAAAIFQGASGLLFNNMWVLLAIIPALIAVHYLVVLKEEAYLEAKFGKAYLDYKSRVRRWI